MPSTVQKTPKLVSITPTASASAFSGTRESGWRATAAAITTTTNAAAAAAAASATEPCAAPRVSTITATSSSSTRTPWNTRAKAERLVPRASSTPARACFFASPVALRLATRRTQDRLLQPLEAEEEQEDPDDEPQVVERNTLERRPEHRDRCGCEHRRERRRRERRPPTAREPDREHDGRRLDELDRAREERGREGEDRRRHLRVDRLYFGREVVEDDAALELQRRRHLSLVHREVARQDREALDLFEARAVSVHGIDDLLHACVLLLVGERGSPVGVECHERGHERPPVADHERV